MPSEHLSNLRDIFRQTAERKRQAAEARFSGAKELSESPRDITLAALEIVAQAFEPEGFVYARSKGDLTKRSSDIGYCIHFQSDRNNVAGMHVGLWIHANVTSKRLDQWRSGQSNPWSKGAGLSGGQIGNLLKKKGWMEWELAATGSRPTVIADAIATIRAVALPYFAQFDDLTALVERLRCEGVEELHLGGAIELALCQGNVAAAQDILQRFFGQRADLLKSYAVALEEFRQKGFSPFFEHSYARAAAHLTLAYNLKPVAAP